MVFIKRIPDPESNISRQKLMEVVSGIAIVFWVGRLLIILGFCQLLPRTSPGVVLAVTLSYLLTVKTFHHAVSSVLTPGEPPPLVWKRGWILLEDPLVEALWRRRR